MTDAAYRDLVAPGGLFPVTDGVVNGQQMRVYDRAPYTLVEAFLATKGYGSAPALVFADQRWTYDEHWRSVMALATSLRERFSVRPGDRVALAMRNYPEWALTFWAVQLLGGVVVPLNAWLTGRELAVLVADSEPVLLVADQERIDRLAAEAGATVKVRGRVVVRGACEGAVAFDDLVAACAGKEVEPHPAAPDDVATILYTSGTTGLPKGVIGTHRNHASIVLTMRMRAEAVRRASGRTAATSPGATLVASPLFHIAALTSLTSNTYAGRCVVLMYKWDLDEGMRLIEGERITEMSAPPTVLGQVVDGAQRGTHDLSSLESVVSGAAPAPPQLIRDIAALYGGRVSPGTGYGATETASTVITITGKDFVEHPTSVGRPLPTVDVRVCDPSGQVVPTGVAGELEVRSPQISAGYAGNPAGTAASFSDGWYRTGDRVTQDADGYIYLVGRLKDVVIRGGENVYSAEVERAVGEHPAVAESAVIGRPHPTLGEEVGAVIRLRLDCTLTAAELSSFLHDRLAAFKIPTWVQLTDEPLPRNAAGKIVKEEVRAALARQGGR